MNKIDFPSSAIPLPANKDFHLNDELFLIKLVIEKWKQIICAFVLCGLFGFSLSFLLEERHSVKISLISKSAVIQTGEIWSMAMYTPSLAPILHEIATSDAPQWAINSEEGNITAYGKTSEEVSNKAKQFVSEIDGQLRRLFQGQLIRQTEALEKIPEAFRFSSETSTNTTLKSNYLDTLLGTNSSLISVHIGETKDLSIHPLLFALLGGMIGAISLAGFGIFRVLLQQDTKLQS